jgi:predicted Rdx family selenoprotein
LVETLVNTFKRTINQPHPLAEIILIPSYGGRYEVTVDGVLIYSKLATGVHTSNEFIVDQVRARLAAP